MKRVVMFSGGAASWAAARRVADTHGTDDLVLVFSDTLMEDEDTYRFLVDAMANILPVDAAVLALLRTLIAQVPPVEAGLAQRKPVLHALAAAVTEHVPGLVWLTGDLDPWGVFERARFIGNSRVDPCSRVLKRERMDRWRAANLSPDDAIIYVGLDWTETNQLTRLLPFVAPWRYEAPLMEPPVLSKAGMLAWARACGLEPPRMYAEGFSHGNCSGGCVKAGHAQWALLYETHPERFAYFERRESELRAELGPSATILNDRTGGVRRPMTLTEFRKDRERGKAPDLFDWGGCGCALDYEPKGGEPFEEKEKGQEEMTTIAGADSPAPALIRGQV